MLKFKYIAFIALLTFGLGVNAQQRQIETEQIADDAITGTKIVEGAGGLYGGSGTVSGLVTATYSAGAFLTHDIDNGAFHIHSDDSDLYISDSGTYLDYKGNRVGFTDNAVAITGEMELSEKADHSSTPVAGKGYVWVKNTAPSTLIFTDDTGIDTTLGSGGGGASQLSDLSDVNTSTPTDKNVLIADGTDWESRALVKSDISDFPADVSQVEAEAGTETAIRSWSPERVKQAIEALTASVIPVETLDLSLANDTDIDLESAAYSALSTNGRLRIEFDNVRATTSGEQVTIRGSDDSGTTFESASYGYAWWQGGTRYAGTDGAHFVIASSLSSWSPGNAAGSELTATVRISSLKSATARARSIANTAYRRVDGTPRIFTASGDFPNTNAVDQLRIRASDGLGFISGTARIFIDY